ncbi:EAL domain-containing protein [Hyphomicrobium facile]|uniref:Diguanylate cyclase (GGDEF) domain-containing protein n=1 Tax=Hyphomicrobium facile TaxID=51670 RepID=A0A1I7NQE2_9HYPH|nr:EAL domain-containing protein [Hyphomicrobium facile]SFV36889.1 diguanylate cyclase (GGDEF) domain-containing protein [Hyphomicrobium facile]
MDWGRYGKSWLSVLGVLALCLVALAGRAEALTPIPVQGDQDRLEITTLGEAYEGRGDSLQVETAPGADGVTGRMTVRASVPGTSPNWMVFALTNKTDKSLERLLTADRYTIVGSGTVWPDLDARRIESVTPSVGFVPERIKSDKADVFRITLEPGQTITYVAELAGERYARMYLWQPIDYEIKSRDRQLFNGAMLGLTGLLAIFLTAIFAANHKLIFPAAALVAWTVLTYLCVDFGFFHKLFNLRPEDNAVYRAAGEAAMASSFVIFLTTFLRLALWHGLVRMMIGVWMVAQLTLIAVAVIDPRLAATFARLSFLAIGGVGGLFTVFLAAKGQDRALSLVPTWLLFLVWIFATGMTLSGRMSGDVVVASLVAGLVLVVILMGFTVTQFAFRSGDTSYAGAPNELTVRSLALVASGSTVWEWNIRRDEIKVGPEVEVALSLMPGELSTKVDEFLKHVHPTDKERFRVTLMSAQERSGIRIKSDFRLRHADNSWRWFELEAASVPNSDGRTLRCVGLLRDVSDTKRAHERLLHDAVHCSLTGLPNRELFLDRLKTIMVRAKTDNTVKPAVIYIDIDKFKTVNASLGLVRGDSLLLTVARRLQRHLGPQDTVARVGGDQFALLFTGEREARNLPALAERVRRSLRAPIPLANQEIILTGSMGIALWDGTQGADGDLLRDAQIAMYRAKQGGTDRIEIFEPGMRRDRDLNSEVEADLARSIEKGQLKVLYQPIVYLPTKELAGFEAQLRWDHPKLGLVNPLAVISDTDDTELLIKLNSHLLLRAAKDVARWVLELPRSERPLFVTVNVSGRQLFRPESVQEIRHVLGRNIAPVGTMRLEISESLLMDNPEQAVEVLKLLRGSGVELTLDDFGTGFSSLAYLHRFPFDTIKINGELVRGSGTGDGAAIVRSMVALAHELTKTIAAEGVERADEAGFLRSIGCEYAQGYHFGEPIPDRAVSQLLKMVRRSERKLQPRGFFRPKPKSPSKEIAKKPARALPSPAQTPSPEEKTVDPARIAAAAKQAALPSGSVVRQRQKATPAPSPAPVNAKPRMNGAAPLATPMNGAHNGAPNGAANAPSDNRQRMNDAPAAPPISMPAPFPQAAHAKQQPPSQSRPLAAKGADAPHLGPPPPPAGLQPNPLQNGSPLPSIMQPPKDRAPERAPPNIVSPLANALARASAAPPPAPAATTPPLPTSPLAAPSIVPASLRSDTPTIVPPTSAPPPLPSNGAGFPSQPSTQPDFSTLPPSIAASLARLAGTPLPTGRTSGGPASPDATTSEQKAAPKVSSGA